MYYIHQGRIFLWINFDHNFSELNTWFALKGRAFFSTFLTFHNCFYLKTLHLECISNNGFALFLPTLLASSYLWSICIDRLLVTTKLPSLIIIVTKLQDRSERYTELLMLFWYRHLLKTATKQYYNRWTRRQSNC